MYHLRLDRKAQKDMDRLRSDLWSRVRDAILSLRDDPKPQGSLKLHGVVDAYRLKVGDYRIVYEVDDASQVVTIRRVKHRSEVYRGL